MSTGVAIQVEHLSKKFSRSLRHAMVYGLRDIAQAALIPHRFRSPNYEPRISDAGREGQVPSTPQSTIRNPQSADLRPDEFWALHDVSFSIPKGERLGIIGPNGAGKSTLFSVLSGIYGPSHGRVEFRGRLQSLIALGAGFHPLLSGRENIYINAAILGFESKWVNRRLEEIIAFADIGEFIDAPVKNYSSGMLVRLGFAVAAHMDPDILLIDEVLAVGDARFQSKCIAFSQRLAEQGRTVVMVSHALANVMMLCRRALWLDRGRIVMDGLASEVVRSYSAWAMQSTEISGGATAESASVVHGEGIRFTYRVVPDEIPDAQMPRPEYGKKLPVVIRGTPLRIVIEYELLRSITGKLDFSVQVKDAISNVRILGTGCCYHDALVPAVAGQKGRVVIEFPRLPFKEGLYCLDVAVSDNTGISNTTSLAIVFESAPSFVVVSGSADFKEPITGSLESRLPLIEWPVRITTTTY